MVVGMAAAWAGNRSVGFSLSAVDTMRMLLIVISAAGSVRRELLLAGACVTLRRHGFICAAASSRTPQQERPSQQHKAPQAGAATGCLPARAARLSLPTSPKHHELAVLWRCHKAASFVIAFPSGLSRAQVLYAKNAHGFLDVAWRPPAPTTLCAPHGLGDWQFSLAALYCAWRLLDRVRSFRYPCLAKYGSNH